MSAPRAIDYAGLIGRHVSMHIGGDETDDGSHFGDVISVMDWDDGSAVMVMFADGRWVDIKAEEADRWRFTIETRGGRAQNE